LADFYEKHLRFGEAIETLLKQAEVAERLQRTGNTGQVTGGDQRSALPAAPLQERLRYRTLHRAIHLIESRRLQSPDALTQFRKLAEWYPEEPLVWRELLAALLNRKQHEEALALLERYR